MHFYDTVQFRHLDRRILQLSILAAIVIVVLAGGVLALMYPAVFGPEAFLPDMVFRHAWYGFCGLSVLLSAYIVDRQFTIVHLRRQILENRTNFTASQRAATEELLAAMPNLKTFQHRLPTEFSRTVAAQERFSIILVVLQLPGDHAPMSERLQAIGDAAAAATRTLRKLRNEDIVYLLGPACLGIILPGADLQAAEEVSRRFSEGLSNAAGAAYRFYFKVELINYPAHGVSAHEIQQVVRAVILGENSARDLAEALN